MYDAKLSTIATTISKWKKVKIAVFISKEAQFVSNALCALEELCPFQDKYGQ